MKKKKHTAHDHRKRNASNAPRQKPLDFEDTTETLDPATLDQMMDLLQQVEAKDLPPKQILLVHHVERPKREGTPPQDPNARVILKYVPLPKGHTYTATSERGTPECGDDETNQN